jgi:anti-sigma factor RsiW
MNIPKAVILDLLPAYLAGEASPETVVLVDEYLKSDPELAERVRSQSADNLSGTGPSEVPAELELVSIRRTKQLIRSQVRILVSALTFTFVAVGAAMILSEWRMKPLHLLLQSYPFLIGVAPALAAACWIAYFWTKRRLRSSGP